MTDPMMRRSLSSPKQGYAFTVLVCLFSASLSSLSHASEMLHWKDAWVRSMPPGAQVTAAYGMLMNHSDQTVTLSTVSSEISGTAEIHEVIANGDQRRMAEPESIDLAPHKTPASWFTTSELPLTGSGKIQKFRLVEMWNNNELEHLE